MPSPPKKSKVSKSKGLGLPILTQMFCPFGMLGKGSFGEVQKVCFSPETPNSPLVAVKIVRAGKLTPKILRKESENFGSPGCAEGVAMMGEDGTYYGFSSIATPLSDMKKIGAEMLESIIWMTKDAIMAALKGVVYDCKPENLGFIPKGTASVCTGKDGQPLVGEPTQEDKVVFIDLGMIDSPEEADKDFNPLLDDEVMESDKEQTKFRNFKCEMMEALLRNQFEVQPQDELKIVAKICTEFEYRYAGGCERYQAEFSEMLF
jgi:hypothetical protein